MALELPQEFHRAGHVIERGLPRVLGSDLVGIYLYGSILDSTFVPGRSDLDCIVVTEEALDSRTLKRLRDWFESALGDDPCHDRIQMSFLVKRRVLEDDPSACLFQFGHLSRTGSDGNPIIWIDHFQRGEVLYGANPREFVPEITPARFRAALIRELGYLREEISVKPRSKWRDQQSYRAYAVLTLCRIMYSNTTGAVTSKRDAAQWVIENGPDEPALHDLVQVAMGMSDQAWIVTLPLPPIKRFIGYVDTTLAE